MLEFAVSVDGVTEEGKGHWVLAVDPAGERLLIAHQDGSFHWHVMSECKFVKLINPDAPRPVIPIQSQPVLALPNRADRRRIGRDGGC